MIKRILTATSIFLLACSCNPTSSVRSWRDDNRLPDDVYMVEEVSTVVDISMYLYNKKSKTVYLIDDLGRLALVAYDTYWEEYYYTGKSLLVDSCVYTDDTRHIFKYLGNKCIEEISEWDTGEIRSYIHNGAHNLRDLPTETSFRGSNTYIKYDDYGRITSERNFSDWKVHSNVVYEYNSHGDMIRERETYQDVPWLPIEYDCHEYDYEYEGDYWITKREYRVLDNGERELIQQTTRKIFRKSDSTSQ